MSVALYTPSSSQIVHEARVDFRQRVIQPMIHIVQYDKSLPIVAVELYSDGQKWPLPETVATVKVRWGKRDHTYVYTDVLGCNADRTIVYIEIIEQMTVFYGEHNPVLEVTIGDTLACSSYIPFYIDRNPVQKDDIVSEITPSIVDVLMAAINAKQDQLVSGTNIKTINGQSILGSGDITISGGGTSIEAITTWSSTVAGYTALVGVDIGGTKYKLLPQGTAHGANDLAIGVNSVAGVSGQNRYATALGDTARATGNSSTALGREAQATVNYSTAVGCGAYASGTSSTALGDTARATGNSSIAIGEGSQATENNSVSIGHSAQVAGKYSVAIGAYSYSKFDNVVSFYGYGNGAERYKVLLIKSTDDLFFANEAATTTTNEYTSLNSFTSGKTLKDYLDAKQATLVAGTNITFQNNADGTVTINASGGGSQVPVGTTYDTTDLAIGTYSVAGVNGLICSATAVGYNAQATNSSSTAVGSSSQATGSYSVAIGRNALATGPSSAALGYNAQATGTYSTALGPSAQATNSYATAVGRNAQATSTSSSALGYGTVASGSGSTSIGYGASTSGQYSTAIGYMSVAKINSWVSFDGSTSNYIRTITAFDPSYIFFRNELVDANKTTQAAYTNGHTLADYIFAYATDAEIEAIFN